MTISSQRQNLFAARDLKKKRLGMLIAICALVQTSWQLSTCYLDPIPVAIGIRG
jgi:hypothetical protein